MRPVQSNSVSVWFDFGIYVEEVNDWTLREGQWGRVVLVVLVERLIYSTFRLFSRQAMLLDVRLLCGPFKRKWQSGNRSARERDSLCIGKEQ